MKPQPHRRPLNDRVMDVLIVVLGLFVAAWLFAPALYGAPDPDSSAVGSAKEDQLLIKAVDGAPPGIVRQVLAANDLALVGSIDEIGVTIARAKPGKGKGVLNALGKNPWIRAEVDGEMQVIPVPADATAQAVEWFISKTRTDVAHAAGYTGATINVTVLDSGADLKHPYIAPRVGDTANFVVTTDTAFVANAQDTDGHGTACFTLVAQEAPDARIHVGRVMYKNSAKWSAVSQGIIWGKDRSQIISISIGGTANSFTLIDAVAKANAAGCVVIVSAANAGTSTPYYPAQTLGAMAVSATDQNDNKASWSSYGNGTTSVIDIAAPGVSLRAGTIGGGWGSFSGTSGSCPITAGITALVQGKFGGTGSAAFTRVQAGAKDLGNVLYFGPGRVDAASALDIDATPPPPEEPPPPVEPPPATTGDITAAASWTTVPAANSGSPWGPEGLEQLTDGKLTTKCLWFVQTAKATATFAADTTLTEIHVASANDHPVRDPGTIKLEQSADGATWTTAQTWTGLTWSARQQNKTLAVTSAHGRVFRLTFTSSGLSSPGGVIVQVAEVRLIGASGTVEPPPPIEETWSEKRETVSVSSTPYAPAEVEQSRTTTTTIRIYEESNLGNIRNDRTETDATTEKRMQAVPVN